jgi:hypothetical protein
MARLSAPKAARGVRADLGDVIVTKAVETHVNQVRQNLAGLEGGLERHAILSFVYKLDKTLYGLG